MKYKKCDSHRTYLIKNVTLGINTHYDYDYDCSSGISSITTIFTTLSSPINSEP